MKTILKPVNSPPLRLLMVANNANGALQVFAISGNDLAIWTNYQTTPGGGWNGWFSMGNAGVRFFYGQP